MHELAQDLRYAARQLRRNPGFTAVAILTLALGIGASTAMFGVLNAVLLRPVPFSNPDRLVRIFSTEKGATLGPSPLDMRDFAAQNRTFDKMAVYDVWRKNVSFGNGSMEPEQMRVGLVPGEYFEVLGVKPLMGRLFRQDENRWGNNFVVIISYNFWQTRFQGDRSVLSKTIRINDEPYSIIGVTPVEVPDPWVGTPAGKTELWTPFVPYVSASDTVWDENQRGSRGWGAIGRLKPGVTIEEASADLGRIANNLATQYPDDHAVGVKLQSLQEDQVRGLRPTLHLLMGAVLLILLIACSNVANLLLARNSARSREVAIRTALGAQGSTLLRQFTAENLVLGLLGGFLGWGLAWSGCATIGKIHPAQLPQLAGVDVDIQVVAFAFCISVLSSLIFGIVPAMASLTVSPAEAFKEGGRTSAGGREQRYLGRMFVMTEMAFAVMLLIGTGLLIQSLMRLQNQPTGFRTDHILRTHFYLPPVRYPNTTSITRFSDEYVSRVRALPGVLDATISGANPPDDQWKQNFTIDGRAVSRLEDTPVAARNVTDSHYLHTLGIPVIEGRGFLDSDIETTLPVALVNQAFVRQYFPAEDSIGKRIRISVAQQVGSANPNDEVFTIVGVTRDTMNRGPALPPMPHITTLFRQTRDLNVGFKTLLVRTQMDPLQLAGSIRQQLHSLDSNLPFAEVATIDQLIAAQTSGRRYTTGLFALFAVLGIVLGGIGVYSVNSYLVTQRTSEIGLRIALGAQRSNVLWMVIQQGLRTAAIGAALGLFAAWLLRQAMAQLVFDISAGDPKTYLIAVVVLLAFATLACYIPARRAAKVDPMVALRYE